MANRTRTAIVVNRRGLLCGGWEFPGVPAEFLSRGIRICDFCWRRCVTPTESHNADGAICATRSGTSCIAVRQRPWRPNWRGSGRWSLTRLPAPSTQPCRHTNGPAPNRLLRGAICFAMAPWHSEQRLRRGSLLPQSKSQMVADPHQRQQRRHRQHVPHVVNNGLRFLCDGQRRDPRSARRVVRNRHPRVHHFAERQQRWSGLGTAGRENVLLACRGKAQGYCGCSARACRDPAGTGAARRAGLSPRADAAAGDSTDGVVRAGGTESRSCPDEIKAPSAAGGQ